MTVNDSHWRGWFGMLSHLCRSGPLPWLLGFSAIGFLYTALVAEPASLPAICGSLARMDLGDLGVVLGPGWSAMALLAGWLAMLLAMMPPLLAQPVLHVWWSSLGPRRPWALFLFGSAYTAVWMGAGAVLIPAAMALRLTIPWAAAAVVALGLALTWSSSPAAQGARNRCHRMRRIAAFGRNADRECVQQGLLTGAACVAACWPWMLLPMMVDSIHAVAMAAVTVMLFVERLGPPALPAWRFPMAFEVIRSLRPPQKVLGSP